MCSGTIEIIFTTQGHLCDNNIGEMRNILSMPQSYSKDKEVGFCYTLHIKEVSNIV